MATEEGKIFVGVIGFIFEVTLKEKGVVVPIDTATALSIVFSKPTQATITRTAVLSTDGLDGKLRYVTIAGDLDLDGWWSLQADVTMPNWDGPSTIDEFEVFARL